MSPVLPPSLQVIERGWLSANNILAFDGDQATLIDSGYVSHAEQTVALLRQALDGRHLSRLFNTHTHSDHIGGNAAVQAAFGCEITVPAGSQARIAEWDEAALLLSPLGQQAARFSHDHTLQAGEQFSMGGLNWQALAAPGHDMEALIFHNPEKRLLISGDALWENGFGVIFPELLGQADGLRHTHETLEAIGRLPVDLVIPGHGSPFVDIDAALQRAFRRLAQFANDSERLAWHAIKVAVAFALMERRRIASADFEAFIHGLPFVSDINSRWLGWPEEQLSERVRTELEKAGSLHREDDWLLA